MVGIPQQPIPNFVVPVYKRIQSIASNTNNGILKVVVHDGTFHTDDVLCVAFLRKAIFDYLKLLHSTGEGFRSAQLHSVNVRRTREEAVMRTAHFVLDVGCEDRVDSHSIRFDHHQKVDSPDTYPNGIKMAACGKLAKWLYEDVDPTYYELLRDKLLYSVEAIDNGQTLEDFEFRLPMSPFGFVSYCNPRQHETAGLGSRAIRAYEDECFEHAVDMAIRVLARFDASYNQVDFDRQTLASALERYNGKGHLKLNSHIAMQIVVEENDARIANGQDDSKVLLVSFPSSDSSRYMLQVVPKETGSFDSWIKLPKEWRGLRGADLNQATGTLGGVFVHPAGFIGSWDSKTTTYLVAEAALKRMDTD